MEELIKAVDNLRTAIVDFFGAVAGLLGNIQAMAAYKEAAKTHPEWVHRACYAKKKRIRKKYHDKIMRSYWEV